MAKNKVINTVLRLQDDMSSGLVKAARTAKKSGAAISDDMIDAARKVEKFKDKAIDNLQTFAKRGPAVAAAGTAGIVGALAALDGATEEYRIAMGKLNAGFQTAGFSADTARKSYRNFYAILGDKDTATEASQLLANMVKSEEGVAKWARIAAGAHGTFGDSLPIEGLVESSNETARTGQITGVLADAINWATAENEHFGVALKANTAANEEWNKAVKAATSAEDYFNLALQDCSSEAERQKLITDTLAKTYDKAADSFYEQNKQVIDARRNQATLDETIAGLGDTSAKAKNKLWELAGAASDGSVRAGSMLDWIQTKAEGFVSWVDGLDLSGLQEQVDDKFGDAVKKAGEIVDWCREHVTELKVGVNLLAGAFALVKVSEFNKSLKDGVGTVVGFGKLIGTMTGLTTAQAATTGTATAAQTGLNAAMAANPIGAVILAVEGLIAIGILLYKNWDKLKSGAEWLWKKFENVSMKIGNAFKGAFDKVKNAGKTALDWVGDKLSWLNDKIESIPILGSLYKGAKGALGTAVEWVDNATTGNRGTTLTDAASSRQTTTTTTATAAGPVKTTTATTTEVPKPDFTSLPNLLGHALGTPYWRGGMTRVNERGGEIMNLPSGTQIIPHDVSVKQGGGTKVTVNVTVQGNVIGNREYTEQVGAYVGRKVLAALGNT